MDVKRCMSKSKVCKEGMVNHREQRKDFDMIWQSHEHTHLHILGSHHCCQEASKRTRILPVDRHSLRKLNWKWR